VKEGKKKETAVEDILPKEKDRILPNVFMGRRGGKEIIWRRKPSKKRATSYSFSSVRGREKRRENTNLKGGGNLSDFFLLYCRIERKKGGGKPSLLLFNSDCRKKDSKEEGKRTVGRILSIFSIYEGKG